MRDEDIESRISELERVIHELRDEVQEGELHPPTERGRLREVQTELDQQWDLLRRRRALAEAGENPDQADMQPASEVETFQQ